MKKQTNVDIISELPSLLIVMSSITRKISTSTRRLSLKQRKVSEWRTSRSSGFADKTALTASERPRPLSETPENIAHYGIIRNSPEDITARVVVPKAVSNGIVMGDVFEVSFREMAANVARDAVAPLASELTFSDRFVQSIPFNQSLQQAHFLSRSMESTQSILSQKIKMRFVMFLQQQKCQRENAKQKTWKTFGAACFSEFRKYEEIRETILRLSALLGTVYFGCMAMT